MNPLFCFALFLWLSISIVLFSAPASAEDPSATNVKQTAEKAVEVRRESQKLADNWAKEEADLLLEIQTLEQELATLKWRREKTAAYMKDLEDKMTTRPVPIAFESGKQIALIDNRYKIYSKDKGENFELYDLIDDPSETNDLAGEKTEIVSQMRAALEEWRASCKNSQAGDDYI